MCGNNTVHCVGLFCGLMIQNLQYQQCKKYFSEAFAVTTSDYQIRRFDTSVRVEKFGSQ
jgi:hypothetical protein